MCADINPQQKSNIVSGDDRSGNANKDILAEIPAGERGVIIKEQRPRRIEWSDRLAKNDRYAKGVLALGGAHPKSVRAASHSRGRTKENNRRRMRNM